MAERWKVPTDCRELALLVAREHTHVHQSSGFGPEARLRLLVQRRLAPPRALCPAAAGLRADARGRTGFEDRDYPQAARLAATSPPRWPSTKRP